MNISLIGMEFLFPMDAMVDGMILGSINGRVVGGIQLIDGKKGKALYTNGVDQWVDLGNQKDNCMGDMEKCSNGFVIALWLKMYRNGTDADGGEFYLTTGGDSGMGFVQIGMILHVHIVSFPGDYWPAHCPTALSLQTWYHVVVTWNSSNGAKTYINGDLVVERPFPVGKIPGNNGQPNVTLGISNILKSPGQMAMDELRVMDAVMNEHDILMLYIAESLA